MAEPKTSWSFVGLTPEARRAAEEAAAAAGMELDSWLTQLIKYTSAMELSGQAKPPGEMDGPGQPPDRQPVRPAAPATTPVPESAEPQAAQATPAAADKHRVSFRPPTDGSQPYFMPTHGLRPSRLNSLNAFRDAEVDAVLADWRANNNFEPITVREDPASPGTYEVISGIERWHAARRAGAAEVPVVMRNVNDEDALKIGLLARMKQVPLPPLSEAAIYYGLMTEANMSTDEVARLVGKPPTHVAAVVRFNTLPEGVRAMLERGEITVLHARALMDAKDPEAIAREVVARRLDIYKTEQLVRAAGKAPEPARRERSDPLDRPPPPEPRQAVRADEPPRPAGRPVPLPRFLAERPEARRAAFRTVEPGSGERRDGLATTDILERHLTQVLGIKVTIAERDHVGVVSLHYTSREQLSDLIARLNAVTGG
ncbi:MAG: ParB/RepB/Spo0J family partition protein [Alphaproteobacteria bacterium]